MTLIYELDLDILSLYLNAKFKEMYVCPFGSKSNTHTISEISGAMMS